MNNLRFSPSGEKVDIFEKLESKAKLDFDPSSMLRKLLKDDLEDRLGVEEPCPIILFDCSPLFPSIKIVFG